MTRPMTVLRSLLGALAAIMLWLPAAGAVDIKAVTTPLGLKAWLVQDKSAPVVSVAFSFAGGASGIRRRTARAAHHASPAAQRPIPRASPASPTSWPRC